MKEPGRILGSVALGSSLSETNSLAGVCWKELTNDENPGIGFGQELLIGETRQTGRQTRQASC